MIKEKKSNFNVSLVSESFQQVNSEVSKLTELSTCTAKTTIQTLLSSYLLECYIYKIKCRKVGNTIPCKIR